MANPKETSERPMLANQASVVPELLKKPNELLVMVPKNGRLSMLTRKTYNAMLYATQAQMQAMQRMGTPADAGTFFSGRLTDLLSSVTSNNSNAVGLVVKHLTEMRSLEVDWRTPDANSDVVWESIGMLSEARVVKKKDGYWAYWAYPPTLFEAIRDLRVYTQVDQTVIARLNTYTSITLYEICARYKLNPSGLTAKQTPDWWVDALTGSSPKLDKETGLPQKRREWRKFKDASLSNAIDEINNFSDIDVEVVEIKTGRAVSAVQFKVKLKAKEKRKPAKKMSQAMLQQAEKADIPLSTVTDFLNRGTNEMVMMYGLMQLEKRVNATHLSTVENKTAYLRHLIHDTASRVQTGAVESSNVAPQIVTTVKTVQSWEDSVRAEVRQRFLALPKNEQRPFVFGAAEKQKQSGTLTMTFQRKVDEESWTTGHVLAASVEFFANSVYGPNWLQDLHAIS